MLEEDDRVETAFEAVREAGNEVALEVEDDIGASIQ